MKLKTIKKNDSGILLEVQGGSVGFTNLIRGELWNDKNVQEAAYIKEHPYMVQPKIFVKMKGKSNSITALKNATKRISVKLTDLKKEFEMALKD